MILSAVSSVMPERVISSSLVPVLRLIRGAACAFVAWCLSCAAGAAAGGVAAGGVVDCGVCWPNAANGTTRPNANTQRTCLERIIPILLARANEDAPPCPHGERREGGQRALPVETMWTGNDLGAVELEFEEGGRPVTQRGRGRSGVLGGKPEKPKAVDPRAGDRDLRSRGRPYSCGLWNARRRCATRSSADGYPEWIRAWPPGRRTWTESGIGA